MSFASFVLLPCFLIHLVSLFVCLRAYVKTNTLRTVGMQRDQSVAVICIRFTYNKNRIDQFIDSIDIGILTCLLLMRTELTDKESVLHLFEKSIRMQMDLDILCWLDKR